LRQGSSNHHKKRIMNVLRAVLTGSLLMLPAIAAAKDVKFDFDKAFAFSTVKT
jgi:hypothetical protein